MNEIIEKAISGVIFSIFGCFIWMVTTTVYSTTYNTLGTSTLDTNTFSSPTTSVIQMVGPDNVLFIWQIASFCVGFVIKQPEEEKPEEERRKSEL